jgi:hydroxymethylpyrimidine pyrophosphatase-like HAD family hydrolase
MTIILIYVDFDGCLAPAVPGETIDLDLIHLIRRLNARSRETSVGPRIAINSGRPEAFIEAHAQVLDIKDFCVFENGAGIFRFPSNHIEMYLDPSIPPTIHEDFGIMERMVKNEFQMNRQPCKEYNLTYLLPEHDASIDQIAGFLRDHVASINLPYYVETGINFINVIVAGTNKGTGLKMAAEYTGFDTTSEVAGIGDSMSDYDFLDLCGFKACPANGAQKLKEKVDYVSPYPFAKGTIDIINHVLESC